ncbi:TPA: transposase, partial [Shigella sonnei]
DMQKNVTPGRRKGCPNYPPEFKQQLVAASCEPGISISKLALEKMALTPICCSNGDNNGARESCYYLLQRAPSYFL